MKRTRRDGLALRGFSRSASAVTRLEALAVLEGWPTSVTVTRERPLARAW